MSEPENLVMPKINVNASNFVPLVLHEQFTTKDVKIEIWGKIQRVTAMPGILTATDCDIPETEAWKSADLISESGVVKSVCGEFSEKW